MLHITSLSDGLEIYKALDSEVRIEILNMLMEDNTISMKELAGKLELTNGALTSHMKKLENSGLVILSDVTTGHGNKKTYTVHLDKILIDLERKKDFTNVYNTEIAVGHYSGYEVYPACGLASAEQLIGEVDDARYFLHPKRYDAQILWFSKGYVEYLIPNFIPSAQRITRLTISAELSSNAPEISKEQPTDISFYINDVCVGVWNAQGDCGREKGLFTPEWWYPNWNQYGLLKLLVINESGTFVDGLKVSDVTTNDLMLDYRSNIQFKMAVEENAEHAGGFTIFGKFFGNYGQDIKVSIGYAPMMET